MAWRMCLRQKITLQTSWELLQERCGFSESEFALFKDLLISHMKSQKNRVGLQGPWPIRRRSSWERWLNRFIDDGIGNQYWGEGTTRKWSLERERDQIRGFMREATLYASSIIGRELRAEKQKPSKTQQLLGSFGTISEEGILEGYSEDFWDEIEPSVPAAMSGQEQRSEKSKARPSKGLILIDISSEAGESPPKRRRGRPRRVKLPQIVTDHSSPGQKPPSPTAQAPLPVVGGRRGMIRGRELRALGASSRETHLQNMRATRNMIRFEAATEANPRQISISSASDTTRTPTPTKDNSQHTNISPANDENSAIALIEGSSGDTNYSSVNDGTSIAAPIEIDYRCTSVSAADATHPDIHEYPDLVLETRLSGQDEIKLIYGTDFTSLPHLVDRIREKHQLKFDQEILGMKVTVQSKIFDVDLEELRDWKYIAQIIVQNGARAEVLVLVV